MGFLGFGAIAALLWYTGHQVIEGTLGIGTLTGFLLYGVAIGGEPVWARWRACTGSSGGDRRHRAGVRDHRHAAHGARYTRRPAAGNRRRPDRARRRDVLRTCPTDLSCATWR